MSSSPAGTPPRSPSILVTVVLVTVPLLLWGVLLGMLTVSTPALARQFAGYHLRVPWMTELVLALSQWLTHHGWVVLPLGGTAVVGASAGLVLLRHLGQPRAACCGFFGHCLVVLVLLLVVGASLTLPWIKLQEGLQK